MSKVQKRTEEFKQKLEELQKSVNECENLDGFVESEMEPENEKEGDWTLPSMNQYSSYLENIFNDIEKGDKKMHNLAKKRLISVENILTLVLQLPVEQTNFLVFLELPKKLLEIVQGIQNGETEIMSEEFVNRLVQDSSRCFGFLNSNVGEMNQKIADLTRKVVDLQQGFRILISENLGIEDNVESLEKPKPGIHNLMKLGFLDHFEAGYIKRRHIY